MNLQGLNKGTRKALYTSLKNSTSVTTAEVEIFEELKKEFEPKKEIIVSFDSIYEHKRRIELAFSSLEDLQFYAKSHCLSADLISIENSNSHRLTTQVKNWLNSETNVKIERHEEILGTTFFMGDYKYKKRVYWTIDNIHSRGNFVFSGEIKTRKQAIAIAERKYKSYTIVK